MERSARHILKISIFFLKSAFIWISYMYVSSIFLKCNSNSSQSFLSRCFHLPKPSSSIAELLQIHLSAVIFFRVHMLITSYSCRVLALRSSIVRLLKMGGSSSFTNNFPGILIMSWDIICNFSTISIFKRKIRKEIYWQSVPIHDQCQNPPIKSLPTSRGMSKIDNSNQSSSRVARFANCQQ